MAALQKAFGYQGDAMNLPVPDLAVALPFYETVLGFRITSRRDSPHRAAVLARDDIRIGLAENGGDPTQDGCAFHVQDLEGLFREFKKNGLSASGSVRGRVGNYRTLLLIPAAISIGACETRACSNQVLASYPSAGNELEAVVYQRNCGTATDPNVQISILPTGASLPDRGGNIFGGVLDSSPGVDSVSQVKVEWIGRNRLHITFDREMRISRKEDSEAAVVIQYTEEP